ncbi:FMN-binding glutamate synthase family protein [Rickettsiales bacterium]|nr:FMN-binding glutamate synthase family protein [Rickettsiales bacterium]
MSVIILYIIDKTQTKHAIRHNYPVIGRMRYTLEHLATFFRQYFAEDREELPFNRAERSWVYRAAKNLDNTVPFGSTKNIDTPGTVYFTNCMYPTIEKDAVEPKAIIIGPYAKYPYSHESFFNISAMSYGSISKPAVLALSKGAKMAGIWMNTGEGGLSPYHLEGGCDIVLQMGTAMFGVRNEQGLLSEDKLKATAAHEQVKMIEIKLSQGAKPGKGGILPGAKVTEEIASIRHIPVGKDAISPNRFPGINNAEDMLSFVGHVREVSGKPTGIKLCVGNYEELDDVCEAILKKGIKAAPDFITIDSGNGGTGASPMALIDNVGTPIRESLPLVVDMLNRYGLKERIKIIASGKLITPSEVSWALCAGADFINNARGFMFALGCIQALQCNNNTCPTGVTTHNKRLQAGLNPVDKSVRVAHYAKNMLKEVGIIAHSCGVKEPRDLRRHHARVVTDMGKSISFAELYADEKENN